MSKKNNAVQKLQLKMLRSQQGIWFKKERVIIVFEGSDAAGKGGAIRKITEPLDPRGFRVHPIGPPSVEDQGRHWLYRFWVRVPKQGMVAIFDRSWYGRVLVERVEKIINKENSYFDYNDNNNNNNNSNGIMIIDDDTNDSNSGSVNIKAQKPNINEVNSIARLKVNAPLASSEHTTPLSRSIDYLNRLDHFKIILNNTNNKNNNNNATRNQHVTSNISATLPIKKYYRLCNNTSVYNSPNR